MAQLGRDAEGKRPTIADLRESGAFEQDADQIWILAPGARAVGR